MPMRTFSPITDSTETSISSPIMMLWLDLRVRTSIGCTFLVADWRPARSPTAGRPSIELLPGERDALFGVDSTSPLDAAKLLSPAAPAGASREPLPAPPEHRSRASRRSPIGQPRRLAGALR